MPNMWLMQNFVNLILITTIFISPQVTFGQTKFSGQTAAGSYRDRSLVSKSGSFSAGSEFSLAGEGNEYLSSVQVGATVQEVTKTDSEEAKDIDLQGGEKIVSKNYNLALSQSLGLPQSIQFLYSIGKIGKYTTKSIGGGVQRWLIMDRVRLGITIKQNDTEQGIKDYADVDGKRVITPDRIDGRQAAANLMVYISNTTIGIFDYLYSTRNDRPATWNLSAQVRQYIERANGSLHMGLTHYENVGSIQPTTTYGSVVANSTYAEWHQKLKNQYILMGGYRFYVEHENPRSVDAPIKEVGSDLIYTSLRYRFNKSWTYRSNELSLSYGHYLHNAGLSGDNISLGVDWFI